jgi:glycosyltransferase involved in cell wall biosynthesis
MERLKIDIGVGGRFHADYMTRALLEAGHDVELFTTFPASKFPRLPRGRVHGYILPELVFRAAQRLGLENQGDLFKMRSFGSWMAKHAARKGRKRDLSITWSSFGLETLRARQAKKCVVVRDSAHILFQNDVLAREFARLKLRYPDRGICLDRELSEYALADRILVPSEFAKRTFVERGFAPGKIDILRLGVNVALFKADSQIAPRLPLHVVYFGTLSVQKGVHHLLEATKDFPKATLNLELVGSIAPEMRGMLKKYSHHTYHPAMPHPRLAEFLRRQDVFVFPSLHDGFGQVLVQAMASGICPIATDHCGAAELVKEGENGFVLPAGDVERLREKLDSLTRDLPRVKQLREAAARIGEDLSWNNYNTTLQRWAHGLFQINSREASGG